MSNRRKSSAEFRAEVVELVISSGRPIVQVAPEIGVVEGTLGNWVRLWKEEHPEPGAAEPSLARLGRPNTRPCRQTMLS